MGNRRTAFNWGEWPILSSRAVAAFNRIKIPGFVIFGLSFPLAAHGCRRPRRAGRRTRNNPRESSPPRRAVSIADQDMAGGEGGIASAANGGRPQTSDNSSRDTLNTIRQSIDPDGLICNLDMHLGKLAFDTTKPRFDFTHVFAQRIHRASNVAQMFQNDVFSFGHALSGSAGDLVTIAWFRRVRCGEPCFPARSALRAATSQPR